MTESKKNYESSSSQGSGSQSPGSQGAKAALFALIATVFFFMALEAAARLFPPVEFTEKGISAMGGGGELFRKDPLLMWRVKGRLSGSHATNSGGFRGDEFSVRKETGEFRIIVLGDSTMWGWGVKQGEYFSVRLEEYLNRAGGRKASVMDAGVPGYTAYQGYWLFHTELKKYKPDLVITYFGINDSHERQGAGRDSARPLPPPAMVPFLRILGGSRIYIDLKNMLLEIKEKKQGSTIMKGGLENLEQRVPPIEFAAYMDRIENEAKEIGADTINITPAWFLRGVVRDDVRATIFPGKGMFFDFTGGTAVYRHDPAFNAKDALKMSGKPANELFLDYCHLSPAGNAVLAESFAKRIDAAGMLLKH